MEHANDALACALTEPAVPGSAVRLGIGGLGLAGTLMVRAASLAPGIQLVAAADTREAPRAAFARDFGVPTYADLEQLCKDPDVEAVYVGTPHQFHAEHAVMAASHGKHVVIEKPMALTLADCDVILQAARTHGVQLLVGHTHAYDPAIRAMRRIIASGRLGRLRLLATLNYTDFLYRPRRAEELDTARGGGIVFNQLPHQLDILRTLGGGLLRSVRAGCAVLDAARPTEAAATAFLEFEDGTAASMVYSGADYFDSDELHGWVGEGGEPKQPRHGSARRARAGDEGVDEGELRAERLAYGVLQLRRQLAPHPPHFGTTIATCDGGELKVSPEGLGLYDADGAHSLALPRGSGYEGLFADLRQALRAGTRPRHDGHWGKAGTEAMLALLQSARERREIHVHSQVPLPAGA
ncbi:Gfo/Idh/MocA family protein [Hydrogenophaga sp.]|uniref:Gfo/Idh/MocA family protein n=1 Tax=Hydrogenophaga sp. TaxID=1904254 RepID=UPI003F6EA6E2